MPQPFVKIPRICPQESVKPISGHPHTHSKGAPIKCVDWVCGPELVPLWAKHTQTNPLIGVFLALIWYCKVTSEITGIH